MLVKKKLVHVFDTRLKPSFVRFACISINFWNRASPEKKIMRRTRDWLLAILSFRPWSEWAETAMQKFRSKPGFVQIFIFAIYYQNRIPKKKHFKNGQFGGFWCFFLHFLLEFFTSNVVASPRTQSQHADVRLARERDWSFPVFCVIREQRAMF